jgi:serine/threonine-protein kinase RIO1
MKIEFGFVERASIDSARPAKEQEFMQTESKLDTESAPSINAVENKSGILRARAVAKLTSPSLIKQNKLRQVTASMSSTESVSARSSAATRQKNLLSSRLSRKGLSGKAKRVDPEVSIVHESESEQESECHTEAVELTGNTDANLTKDNRKPNPATGKKLDLGYMWEWDPTSRPRTQDTKQRTSGMERIEEGSTSGQSTGARQGATSSSDGSVSSSAVQPEEKKSQSSAAQPGEKESQPSAPQPEEKNIDQVETHKKTAKSEKHSTPTSRADEKERMAGRKAELVRRANLEFLPLVHEDNILRVNGTAYAKLGMIGKGGSCKVYRALSKKCSVVAIKKVKLAGLDRKAIEGYANEISLLKRLRGNSAIIQMYDSEVDLERKFIFVVMELGEVDLEHVLQQRALSGTCRSLNMNFIRLTWQQMLSAVHCIHEERIIHSDLKPANFLFVRGALKLIDFGIAKAIQSDDTNNIYRESTIGTLNYMSPEAILDTGSGQNGPRMKIGRVSTGFPSPRRIFLRQFLNKYFLCRLQTFGPLGVFSMKWSMVRPLFIIFSSSKSFKQSSTQTIK